MIFRLFLAATMFSFALFGKGNSRNVFSNCPTDFIHTPAEEFFTVKTIEIEGCPQQPCTLVKTENFVVYGLVVAHFPSSSLNYIVTAVTPLGPLDLFKGDMSQFLRPRSNFEPGMEIAVKTIYRIPEFVPAYKGVARMSILKPNNEAVFCGQFNVTVKEPPINVLGVDLSEGLLGRRKRK